MPDVTPKTCSNCGKPYMGLSNDPAATCIDCAADVTPKPESGRAPGTYRTPEGGIEVIVGIEESTSYVEDMWPDEVAYIRQEAASKAVAEVLDRLDKLIDRYERTGTTLGHSVAWDLRELAALIASERKP